MKAKDVTYTIDRTFDKVGVFTTFEDLPVDGMGYTTWPEDMKPDVTGTPVDIRNHMKKVRQEGKSYFVAIWIDGYLFTSYTTAMLYYIEQASYSRSKPFVFEGTVYDE